MAITTYTELKAAAANWLVRGDLTARIPEFICLAERRLTRKLRTRLAEQDRTLTATVSSRTIALPTDFSEALAAWILEDGNRRELRFQDPATMITYAESGRPMAWTINGADLAFERPCDTAYSIVLRMLAKYALSDAAPTNALLTEWPDAYLFATLCEAAPFLRDADLAAAYEARFAAAVNEINAKAARSRSAQTLSVEPAGLIGRRERGYSITSDR